MGNANDIIFTEPVFKTTIWGGRKLKDDFGFDIPSDTTGECWAISAHKNGDCTVSEGKYKGEKLSALWKNHPELFGNGEGEFPLLIKILDAREDLSIQVHPDDTYAKEYENGSLGKTECWYILDCDSDATIVIGHNAQTRAQAEEMIKKGDWKSFIREVPIKKGDFFQIEPGCMHAIKGGTLILETQQSSDITYRVYDYDRLQNGKLRELHIEKSLDVLTVPFAEAKCEKHIEKGENHTVETLVSCRYYTVDKIDVSGKTEYEKDCRFMNVTVIDGCGSVCGRKIKKGDSFVVPFKFGCMEFDGDMSLITSYC